MAECPFIDRTIIANPPFNKPVEYQCLDQSIYVFYRHFDGFDTYYHCQFCKLIGRKRDVFECLNESEWQACSHYQHVIRTAKPRGEQ